MTASIQDAWTALDDLELAARHMIARPTNAGARAGLKRACDRSKALRDLESAARRAMDTVAPDERPEPPRETEPTHGVQPSSEPERTIRLPYRDD